MIRWTHVMHVRFEPKAMPTREWIISDIWCVVQGPKSVVVLMFSLLRRFFSGAEPESPLIHEQSRTRHTAANTVCFALPQTHTA